MPRLPIFRVPVAMSALGAALAPLSAAAHTGHLAEAAGHNHWLGAAALGAAAAVAAWQLIRAAKAKAEAEAKENAEAAGEEAAEARDGESTAEADEAEPELQGA